MASSKFKGSHMVVSSLRKENACLKKTLAEMSRQHTELYKLVERLVSLETLRLENSQHLAAEDEKAVSPPEQLSKKGENQMDNLFMRQISDYVRETEEIKNKLVTITARCQDLENKVAGKKDSKSDEQDSKSSVKELQNDLRDALEKNKQWLEYDQQREAYVRGIMARMLWLEKQLNEANQARSQQHNEDHSDEKEAMHQMQEYYERLLKKATDELQVLREEVDITRHNLIITQNWYNERELEVEELKQQLQTEKASRESALEDHRCSVDVVEQLRDETKDLQCKLDEERRRSAKFELQGDLFQRFMLKRQLADKEKIADLERQITISSQDLEDEMQNCSYLKKQMFRVLKMLQKTEDHVTKQAKTDQGDHDSSEETQPPSQLSRDSLTSTTCSSLLNESFLECPSCHAMYPATHYRELMNHLEFCLD
ncbi:centrosomal protein of 55 kDa-like isoform X1 [Lates japonicus]|uniref:Centrosomal protein of 55 kDa-like isoform X1 n=1 Tax=Lates japonicus TaxID=270547 RepID=A0AAD3N3X8_LATJO|nr:centrosomal protein of 55 kDa-like isoform X1 [Lates japonicus]